MICIVNQRRFNRRGIGGMQHFRNFLVAVVTTLVESIVKKVGYVLVLLGAYLHIRNGFN